MKMVRGIDYVKPTRRGEVLRRITAVTEYLAIEHPSLNDVARLAAELGITTHMFYRLVRTWRAHPDARRMPGAGTKVERPSRKTHATPHIIDAIRSANVGTPLADIHRDVSARCLAAGLKPAPYGTVQAHMRKERPEFGRPAGERRIILAVTTVAIPVRNGNGLQYPSVALALGLPEGTILAHNMVGADPNAANAAIAGLLLEILQSKPTVEGNQIEVYWEGPPAGEVSDLLRSNGIDVSERPAMGSRRIGRIVDCRIGGIKIFAVASRAKAPEKLLTTDFDEGLDPSQAAEAVRPAISVHNQGRPMPMIVGSGQTMDSGPGAVGFGAIENALRSLL